MLVCARVHQNKIVVLFLLFIVQLVPGSELNKEVATVLLLQRHMEKIKLYTIGQINNIRIVIVLSIFNKRFMSQDLLMFYKSRFACLKICPFLLTTNLVIVRAQAALETV